jgi:CIC family chloride channel protein
MTTYNTKSLFLMTLLQSRVIRISTASILAGIFIGLVGGAFRYLLIAADSRRNALISWAHAWPYVGWLAPVALGLVGAAATPKRLQW